MSHHTRFALSIAAAVLFSGCFSSSKTEYVDEARTTVSFDSPRAERLFTEGIARNRARIMAAGNPQETTHLTTIVVNVRRQVVTRGPNRDYNLAVQFCDTDRNGMITEAEAEAFSNAGMPPARPVPAPISPTTS